jgi:hypothetical protein
MKEDNSEYYLEIEEICILFKSWLVSKPAFEIKEFNIINLIRHFYPDIIIDENKFIYGINCNLWNKNNDIIKFIDYYKEKSLLKDNDITSISISIYDLYSEYSTKYCKKNKNNIIIGKQYFELFMSEYNYK